MKKKIFFTVLSLFLVFFCSTLMIISIISLRDNISSVKEKCLSEHYVIASALISDIQALDERKVDIISSVDSLMNKYARYSQGKGNALGLSYKDEWIYLKSYPEPSDVIRKPSELSMQQSGQERIVYVEKGQEPVLCIYGNFPAPYQDYGLLYTTNLNVYMSSWRRMKNTLFLTGTAASLILSLCLGIFLNVVFDPLKQISTVSATIANGEYSRRLPEEGKDEIADMAHNFNNMAGQVEAQIKELEETAEQKQQFIDNFAHELKTPLTAIYGYAEYIRRANISEDERLECTGYIMSECERLQNMAYQLLDLATLREIQKENVDIKEIFAESEHIMQVKAKEKNITLKYESDNITVFGNRELLLCMINNLIDNSIKASKSGMSVSIIAGKTSCSQESSKKDDSINSDIDNTSDDKAGNQNNTENNHIIIEIKDEGHGMDKEQLLHIKEAFYRVDKARSRESGGAGLGLSICDRIAKLHNAELEFTSEKGKGTSAKTIF